MDTYEESIENGFYSFPLNDDENSILGEGMHNHEISELLNNNLFEPDNDISDLVEMLSNSVSPIQGILDPSLDDILIITEEQINNRNDIIPDDKLLLLKVPENVKNNDALLDEVLNVELDQSLVDEIEKALSGNNGIFLNKLIQDENENSDNEIVKRPPLAVVQQVVKYPAKTNPKAEVKKPSKRKQSFPNALDFIELFISYSDNEAETEEDLLDDSLKSDEPSPKKIKIQEPIVVEPIEKQKSPPEVKKGQKCSQCDKFYKRISLHRCKVVDALSKASPIPKLRPSDVPLKFRQCSVCKDYFDSQDAIEDHQMLKHSHLVCKVCKQAMKNVKALKQHSLKCGLDIEAVKKPAYLNSKKMK